MVVKITPSDSSSSVTASGSYDFLPDQPACFLSDPIGAARYLDVSLSSPHLICKSSSVHHSLLLNPHLTLWDEAPDVDDEGVLQAGLDARTLFYWVVLWGAKKILKMPVPDWATNYMIPQPLMYPDRYYNERLAAKTTSFMDGMTYLLEEQKLPKPEDALRRMFKFLFTRPPISLESISKDSDLVRGYYDLTEDDVREMIRRYKFEYEQLDRIVSEVAREVGGSKKREEVLKKSVLYVIGRARPLEMGGEGLSVDILNSALANTEEDAGRLRAKLRRVHGNVTKKILEVMVEEIEPLIRQIDAKGLLPEKIILKFGEEKKVIDYSKVPPDIRARKIKKDLLSCKRMLAAIESSGGLSPEHASVISGLGHHYPEINRFKELSGSALEEMIDARDKGVDLLLRSRDPTDYASRGINLVLLNALKNPKGVVGCDIEGEEFRVVDWSGVESRSDEPLKVYGRGKSRVGPYTFYESRIIRIRRDGSIKVEPALSYVDRRGRPGIMGITEMRSLQSLASSLKSNAINLPHGKEIVKSFFKFFNDLQRAWISVDWVDRSAEIKAVGGSLRLVEKRAELIARLSPGYELIRTLRQQTKSLIDKKTSLAPEVYHEVVTRIITNLTEQHVRYFAAPEMQQQFKGYMVKFGEEILAANEKGVLKARRMIKTLTFRRMDEIEAEVEEIYDRRGKKVVSKTPDRGENGKGSGRLRGNMKTIAWGEEAEGWKDVAVACEKRPGELNAWGEKMYRLSLYRINENKPPSLSAGDQFFAEKKYIEALYEYGRVMYDGEVKISTRLNAAVKLFEAAYLSNEAALMNKALSEIGYLDPGGTILSPEQKSMLAVALDLERIEVVEMPAVLREVLQAGEKKVGVGLALDITKKALLGHEKPKVLVMPEARAEFLTKDCQRNLDQLIRESRSRGLMLFDGGMLRHLAAYTEAEFEAFLTDTGFQMTDEENIKRYYEEAREVVRRYGYDIDRLKKHPAVKQLAERTMRQYKGPKTETPISMRLEVEATMAGRAESKGYGLEGPFSRKMFSPWPWLYDLRDVAGPSTIGLLTFLTARSTLQYLYPAPERPWESAAVGYSTLGGAILLDHGVYRGANKYLTWRTGSPPNLRPMMLPRGFSYTDFASGLGEAIFISSFISGMSQVAFDASPETADLIGLGGMGAILGGARPFIAAVAPRVSYDLAMAEKMPWLLSAGKYNFITRSSAPMLSSTIRKVFPPYLVMDAGLTVTNAVYDGVAMDDLGSMLREAEYLEFQRRIRDISFFGENKTGAPFSERVFQTANVVADVVVPPAYVQLMSDLSLSPMGEWREWKMAQIGEKIYAEQLEKTRLMAEDAAAKLENDFRVIVGEAIWSQTPPTIMDILERLSFPYINEEFNPVYSSFDNWQGYEMKYVREHDRHWLFRRRVVDDGRVLNHRAIAFWMSERFNTILEKMIIAIGEVQLEGDNTELIDRARRIIERYAGEFRTISRLYEYEYEGGTS